MRHSDNPEPFTAYRRHLDGRPLSQREVREARQRLIYAARTIESIQAQLGDGGKYSRGSLAQDLDAAAAQFGRIRAFLDSEDAAEHLPMSTLHDPADRYYSER